jgi:hypothetical protein
MPDDGGLPWQRWHGRRLVLWTVEFREWGPGRCLVFLLRKRTRTIAQWDGAGGKTAEWHCHAYRARTNHFRDKECDQISQECEYYL